MNHKLSRQIIDPVVIKIVDREMNRQKVAARKPNAKQLAEFAAVVGELKHKPLPPYLVRKKLPGRLGHGIFLHPKAPPILRGQIIGPYAGEVSIVQQNWSDESDYAFAPLTEIRLSREEQKRFDGKNVFRPNRRYAMKLDADKKGNFMRFINHSYKPNVFADLMEIRSRRYGLKNVSIEIVYVAKKKIRPGEQLMINYDAGEKGYWIHCKPLPVTPQTFTLDEKLRLIDNR